MFGWLQKRGENARVYMCIKEVKWDLEAGDQPFRAKMLAQAQWFRHHVLDSYVQEVIDDPVGRERQQLMEIYGALEDQRNLQSVQLSRTQSQWKQNLGENMPDFFIEQMKLKNRAIEVWMCTLGAEIVSDRRADVAQIWTLLAGALPRIVDAIAELADEEARTSLGSEDMSGRMWSEKAADVQFDRLPKFLQ